MPAAATYFDGRSAGSVDGTVELVGQAIRFHAGSTELHVAIGRARLVEPVGSGAWTIELEDGGSLRIRDEAFGERLAAAWGRGTLVRRLEKSWPWALTAIAVAVLGSWVFLTWGVPLMARHVAFALPPALHARLGQDSIDLLDRLMFEESRIDAARRDEILRLFRSIPGPDSAPNSYTLHFRAAPGIGANAFAVPGGHVIITDEMLDLTESDAEIAGVLAHEVGHLVERHGLRIILQNSVSALFIAGLTGDLTNVTALSATVPTALMQARYSRDFEREADAYAFDYLAGKQIDTGVLAKLLQRVEQQEGDPAGRLSQWFSSHPLSAERTPEQAQQR